MAAGLPLVPKKRAAQGRVLSLRGNFYDHFAGSTGLQVVSQRLQRLRKSPWSEPGQLEQL
eukprot:10939860-Alexandrium_andersonii.AAC.1